MQVDIGRTEPDGPIAIILKAQTFAEVHQLGRWHGAVEAAGGNARSVTTETHDTGQIRNAAAVLIIPIVKQPPPDAGTPAEILPTPGATP